MTWLDEAIGADPELEATFRVAAAVGRELLTRELEAAGLTESALEDLLAGLSLPRLEDFGSADVRDLGKALDGVMARDAADPGIVALIDQAATIDQRDHELQGLVGDAGRFLITAALGIALILAVAKLDGRYDWRTGDGYVALDPGIPPGFQGLADALRDLMSAGLRAADKHPSSLPSPNGAR